MKKTVGILLLLAIVGGAAAYFYVFHKPHRDVAGESASLITPADALVNEFKLDLDAANAKYLDKVVEVKGLVSEEDSEHILLESGVYCVFLYGGEQPLIGAGVPVSLKGRVVGFDELFEEVRMDFCEVLQ